MLTISGAQRSEVKSQVQQYDHVTVDLWCGTNVSLEKVALLIGAHTETFTSIFKSHS